MFLCWEGQANAVSSPPSDAWTSLYLVSLGLSLKDFIYLFLERGEGREKEGEINIDVREKH